MQLFIRLETKLIARLCRWTVCRCSPNHTVVIPLISFIPDTSLFRVLLTRDTAWGGIVIIQLITNYCNTVREVVSPTSWYILNVKRIIICKKKKRRNTSQCKVPCADVRRRFRLWISKDLSIVFFQWISTNILPPLSTAHCPLFFYVEPIAFIKKRRTYICFAWFTELGSPVLSLVSLLNRLDKIVKYLRF